MRRPLMWICLGGIACIFIIYKIVLYCSPPPDYGSKMTVSGRLIKKEFKNDNLVLYLKNTKVKTTSNSNSADRSKGFICYIDTTKEAMDDYCLGSRVVLYGFGEKIKNATNPGEFDAAKYYGARGYVYRLSKTETLSVTGGNDLTEGLFRLRLRGTEIFGSIYGEEYGGILSAMLLGEKTALDEESRQIYSLAGISHILAISGLHISLIGAFVYALLGITPVRPKESAALTVLFLVMYGFMVGFAPSVFRAIFMFACRLLARQLKRAYDPPTALVLSAFLTVCFCPEIICDSSYALTYLAVVGILLVGPCFAEIVGKKTVFDGLFAGAGIFAVTLPVILCSYHRISFVGILLNFFVLPAMPVLFTCAFLSLFLSLWTMRAAAPFVTVCRSILFTIEYLSEKSLRIPHALMYAKTPGPVRCIVYFAILLAVCMVILSVKRKCLLHYYKLVNEGNKEENGEMSMYGETPNAKIKKLYRFTFFYRVAFAAVLVLLFLFITGTPKRFTLTFLDVGQGDGIFLRTDSGDVFLIDGGSTSKKNVGDRIIVPYLKYEGENTVDCWFLTHEDADHVNGFREVLEDGEIRVSKICLPSALKEEFAETARLAERYGIKVYYLDAGDVISGEGRKPYEFHVLSPDATGKYEDSNAASLAFIYREGSFSALFMGDSETQAEEAVLKYWEQEGEGRPEVLKCAHHGSANRTNTERFLYTLRPENAVISCGKNNRYGHPHREVLQRLKEVGSHVLRTDLTGAVIIQKQVWPFR